MRNHFSKIFWGLLVVVIDISINGFDVLADSVGYLIIAAGCRGLAGHSPGFSTAGTLAFVLAVLSLIGFAVPGEIAAGQGVATSVVNCVFFWQLLGGIAEFAIRRDRPDRAKRAENLRIAYVAIIAGTTFFVYALSRWQDAAPLVVLLFVSFFVLMAMILHLIHRTKIELAN